MASNLKAVASAADRVKKLQARKLKEQDKEPSVESISNPNAESKRVKHDKFAMLEATTDVSSDAPIESGKAAEPSTEIGAVELTDSLGGIKEAEAINADQLTSSLKLGVESNMVTLRSGARSRCYIIQIVNPAEETTVFEYNLRPELDLEDTSDIDDSIVAHGTNATPVVARNNKGKVEVICGSRRRASTIKGNKPLTALVIEDVSDNDAKYIAVSENQGRKGFDIFTQVAEWEMLLEGPNPAFKSVQQLATIYEKKDRTYISRNRIIKNIPKEVYLNFTDRQNVKMKHAFDAATMLDKLPLNRKGALIEIYSGDNKETTFTDFAADVKKAYEEDISQNVGENETKTKVQAKKLGTTTVVEQYERAYLTSNRSQKAVVFALPDNVDFNSVDIKEVNDKLEALFAAHLSQ